MIEALVLATPAQALETSVRLAAEADERRGRDAANATGDAATAGGATTAGGAATATGGVATGRPAVLA